MSSPDIAFTGELGGSRCSMARPRGAEGIGGRGRGVAQNERGGHMAFGVDLFGFDEVGAQLEHYRPAGGTAANGKTSSANTARRSPCSLI